METTNRVNEARLALAALLYFFFFSASAIYFATDIYMYIFISIPYAVLDKWIIIVVTGVKKLK